MTFGFIPSPGWSVWQLGPLAIHAYALCILAGIFVAIWITERRWVTRGGVKGQIADVALWAVPAGIVGARLYHVMTDWTTYFGSDGLGFLAALKIWQGGLGIWGGVAGGALGAWYACRRYGLLLPAALPAGRYTLDVGLYDPVTGQRLAVSAGPASYAIELGPVQVE